MNKIPSLSLDEISATSKEAYIYAYAMLENYRNMYKQVVDKQSASYIGGFNKFRHYPSIHTKHDNNDFNNDVSYSWAWLDLRAEPYILSVPEVLPDRYYLAQCFDLFSHNFTCIGTRNTGFKPGKYLFYRLGWQGTLPHGITNSFPCESDLIGIRIQTAIEGEEDTPYVKAIQARYCIQSLSNFLGKPAQSPLRSIHFPAYNRNKAYSHDFIGYLNFLLGFCQTPHLSEVDLMQRFSRIGIGTNIPWKAAEVKPAFLCAINDGIEEAKAEIQQSLFQVDVGKGVAITRESINNNYMKRTTAAIKGLYTIPDEELWYSSFVGNGTYNYTLYFPAGHLPPAKFFWSITIYTLPEELLVDNPIKRYSIGDRTRGLHYGADGSLMLYIQSQSPGKKHESNWLPAPSGDFRLAQCVYGPGLPVLKGNWKFPLLEVIKYSQTEKVTNKVDSI